LRQDIPSELEQSYADQALVLVALELGQSPIALPAMWGSLSETAEAWARTEIGAGEEFDALVVAAVKVHAAEMSDDVVRKDAESVNASPQWGVAGIPASNEHFDVVGTKRHFHEPTDTAFVAARRQVSPIEVETLNHVDGIDSLATLR
jgi:hypothetical protein